MRWGWKHVQDLAAIFELTDRRQAEVKLRT